jgi:hypothetical protein
VKKQWLLYLSVILLFGNCKKPSCFENAGPMVTVQRTAAPFHRIELFDDVNVILTQDSGEAIKVRAPQNIEPNISTDIVNGILSIKNNTSCKWLRKPSEQVDVYVSVKELDHFEYAGSGNVSSSNTILADNITFYSAKGAGNIDIALQAKTLTASVEYESADFIFRGKADVCYCYANARATLGLKDFEVKHLVIGYAGVRDVTVNASEVIEATIYHTGNVYYKGNPANILTTFYSSGRLYHVP